MDKPATFQLQQFAGKRVGDLRVIELFFYFIIIWVLVGLWSIFFKNLSMRTLGLDQKNPIHTFGFAFAATAILLAFVILAADTAEQSLVNSGVIKDKLNSIQAPDQLDGVIKPSMKHKWQLNAPVSDRSSSEDEEVFSMVKNKINL